MAEGNEVARMHVWVKGRVQNVGYRAHVQYNAHPLQVTGWVRNVGNDTVEAVAEGVREKLDRFLVMMKTGPRGGRVDEAKIEWENPTGEYTVFGVRPSI